MYETGVITLDAAKRESSRAAIGARIQALREAAGLSQSELGRRTGIPQRTISSYESGVARPSYPYGAAIAAALGTDSDYIYTGKSRGSPALPPEITAEIQRGLRHGMWVDDFRRAIDWYLMATGRLAGSGVGNESE